MRVNRTRVSRERPVRNRPHRRTVSALFASHFDLLVQGPFPTPTLAANPEKFVNEFHQTNTITRTPKERKMREDLGYRVTRNITYKCWNQDSSRKLQHLQYIHLYYTTTREKKLSEFI